MQQYDKRYFIGSLTRHDTIINIPAETTLMVRDYCGSHIYRDGVLERVMGDYGYWADGQWHYHIKDYQGNVRAVIDGQGALKEVNNYYPYGALMGGGTVGNPGVQPYKYGTKELDRQRDKRTVPVSHEFSYGMLHNVGKTSRAYFRKNNCKSK